ncbi:MAG: hypothetical protein WAV45_02135 [Propionibacteriaceae bacterium]|nr:hypothetical protein [Micropruina sp.]HBX81782.1 hypothetical protein [Propionibacteriaceae bacterium]HBY24111.1 hypothetical protein [Propionibacteriaceae bacterium]
MKKAIFALAATVLLAGCTPAASPSPASSGSTTATSAAATTTSTSASATPKLKDATQIAGAIKQASTTNVVTITEDNDPNSLIGRPNGYASAAVFYDSGVTCPNLGTSCGGAVEVFANETEAQARAQYIQNILKGSPVLGTEYDTVHGAALLRVTGKVKPSVAAAYAAAFTAG